MGGDELTSGASGIRPGDEVLSHLSPSSWQLATFIVLVFSLLASACLRSGDNTLRLHRRPNAFTDMRNNNDWPLCAVNALE